MILIVIYLLGCITSLILNFKCFLNEYKKITVSDLSIILFASIFSWIGLILTILDFYGDKVIICKQDEAEDDD